MDLYSMEFLDADGWIQDIFSEFLVQTDQYYLSLVQDGRSASTNYCMFTDTSVLEKILSTVYINENVQRPFQYIELLHRKMDICFGCRTFDCLGPLFLFG